MLLLEQKHAAVNRWLVAELAEVETRFAAELLSELPCVNDLVRHLERYRGKMLRPMLLLLSARAAAPDKPVTEAHRSLATVVEMVHMATLVHDDILDEADVRRRGSTVNALRGNEPAVMLGDYLISHAYHLCSSLNSQMAARAIARATNVVCEGELLQLANRDNWSLDEQTYMQIIQRKTAALVGTACNLGARHAQASPVVCEKLGRFGEQLGMAFQIVDDLLDLVGDVQVMGKSLNKDLEKGKLTLPLIHWLETADRVKHQMMLDLLRAGGRDRAQRIGELLADSDSVKYARRRAEALIGSARQQCLELPESSAREALIDVAEAVLARNY